MNERLILVTNDDGYDSKGMEAAIEVARAFGRVVVVASRDDAERHEPGHHDVQSALPAPHPRGGGRRGFTRFRERRVDCVKMAFDYLLRDERVDMVISGVNHGSNSAVNVLYSGTMGAAIEGSFYGCPAVGLSLDDHGADADFAAAVVYGRRIVGDIFAAEVELPLCLNVNVPVGSVGELKGMKLCRQNRGFWREEFYRHEDPRGREYFWLTGEFVNGEPEATDTDEGRWPTSTWAVVPVQVDLTGNRQLKNLTKVLK